MLHDDFVGEAGLVLGIRIGHAVLEFFPRARLVAEVSVSDEPAGSLDANSFNGIGHLDLKHHAVRHLRVGAPDDAPGTPLARRPG